MNSSNAVSRQRIQNSIDKTFAKKKSNFDRKTKRDFSLSGSPRFSGFEDVADWDNYISEMAIRDWALFKVEVANLPLNEKLASLNLLIYYDRINQLDLLKLASQELNPTQMSTFLLSFFSYQGERNPQALDRFLSVLPSGRMKNDAIQVAFSRVRETDLVEAVKMANELDFYDESCVAMESLLSGVSSFDFERVSRFLGSEAVVWKDDGFREMLLVETWKAKLYSLSADGKTDLIRKRFSALEVEDRKVVEKMISDKFPLVYFDAYKGEFVEGEFWKCPRHR
ncbi:hypothetical protein [Roseibacillus ishigakijimensis]|uniref:Uncharacterized protein n=1 Tax=Roseibacillus ishigakijimensis TaxID=454146 RepID=A0A934VM43_9BACT|nr:hypothetical protein [Roseibacillus ishigakijimensis]MBK1835354.1 hypothetical protein [Roseibacillus ishigakijimensis]